MKQFRNWAPPGVLREKFTASDFVSRRADGRFESSLGFLMHAIRGIKPKLSFDAVRTRDEFFVWRRAVRDKLRELLKMTDRLTAEFKLLKEEKREGFLLQKYEFYPEDGLAVPILMLIPDAAVASGKPVPAVICNPGSGAGLGALAGEPEGMRSHAQQAASRWGRLWGWAP